MENNKMDIWKRNDKVSIGQLGPTALPSMPPKKEFKTMLEMLLDAEKYDNDNEIECRDVILRGLSNYIEQVIKNDKNGMG